VCIIDLNNDGRDEYIVQSPSIYSGGPAMVIFESCGTRLVDVGYLQGAIYFGPRVNGYFQIIEKSGAGGGLFTRALNQYRRGKYRPVRISDYATDPDGHERFLKERDPSAYDE